MKTEKQEIDQQASNAPSSGLDTSKHTPMMAQYLGNCEVNPQMQCVWAKAFERKESLPLPNVWKKHFNDLRPPVDMQLKGTSSWINLITKRDQQTPKGWRAGISSGEAQ